VNTSRPAPGPEADLVALVRSAPGNPAAFAAAAARVSDWDGLVALAARHGLAPALGSEAARAGVRPAPGAALRLEAAAALGRAEAGRLRSALAEVLAVLAAARVETACLKGPLLGERLYGDAALRPSSDLDLLVSDADFERGAAALAEAGWRAEEGAPARYLRRHHQHLSFSRAGAPAVELHFRALVGFGISVPSEDLLARAVPHPFSRAEARILCPEDEVLYLGLHAAGHLLARLGWLYDLKLLLAGQTGLDWAAVAARAEALRAAPPLAFALERARDLGAPVPRGLLPGPGARARLAERVRRFALGRPEPSPWFTGSSLAFHALLCDRRVGAARYLAHHLGRIARRRVRRWLPGLAPEEWSA
jgi:Uncharacterised nucleotidyltransferase